jgi:hypothetical protein
MMIQLFPPAPATLFSRRSDAAVPPSPAVKSIWDKCKGEEYDLQMKKTSNSNNK